MELIISEIEPKITQNILQRIKDRKYESEVNFDEDILS